MSQIEFGMRATFRERLVLAVLLLAFVGFWAVVIAWLSGAFG